MFFSQKFGKRSAFTGSSTQNEHMTQRKTIFQSTTFAYFKGARSREMLSSLLLWKSRTVRCGAICRLTKPFGGTRFDAVIRQKNVHTGDLFLLWHKMF